MKILMLTPDSQMIDRRILQEAKVLVDRGHEVTLLAGFECKEAASYEQDGIRIHRFVYDWDDERLKPVRNRIGRHPRLYRFVHRVYMGLVRRFLEMTSFERFIVGRGLEHPADVVHCHDLPVLRSGVAIARAFGAPLVFDAHELYHAQEVFPREVRERLLSDEKQLIREAAAVITVNEFIAAELQRIHRIPMPWVLYNSVDAPADDVVRERRGVLLDKVPGEGPLVLFQGWISAERNLDTLIRAMAFVPAPARLAVIGYGDHLAVLQRIAKECGVADRVHFLGRIPSEELLAYTVQADLGVVPYLPVDLNHLYCSPNKFFEFTLSGVPVLAHDLPFFRAMRDRHGVVSCGDLTTPEAAARSIRAALEPSNLARLRANCIAARSRLEWRNDADRLLQVYAGLETVHRGPSDRSAQMVTIRHGEVH
ncbi:MAG: glycosyltransferase family 4 protein [Planctomycetota bacterium]